MAGKVELAGHEISIGDIERARHETTPGGDAASRGDGDAIRIDEVNRAVRGDLAGND